LTAVKSVTEPVSDAIYRRAVINAWEFAMEMDSWESDGPEPGERILSPAQRSMRCFATLFCLAVLATSTFFVSHMDARAVRGEPGVSATQPEIKSPVRENQKKASNKWLIALTPNSEKPAS
jgi:hypothetical protein